MKIPRELTLSLIYPLRKGHSILGWMWPRKADVLRALCSQQSLQLAAPLPTQNLNLKFMPNVFFTHRISVPQRPETFIFLYSWLGC